MSKRKQNRPPAFQFYAGDFLRNQRVMLMSLEARGAYITLLCSAWLEGSVPSDLDKLARLCGITREHMEELWTEISPCFVLKGKKDETRLVNKRLESERNKQRKYRKKQSENAKKGVGKDKVIKENTSAGTATEGAKTEPEGSSSSSSSFSSSPSGYNIDIDSNEGLKESLKGTSDKQESGPELTPAHRDEIEQILYELQRDFGVPQHDIDSYKRQWVKYGYSLMRFREAFTALKDKRTSGDLREPAKYFQRCLTNGSKYAQA